jgi:Bromodomain/Bromodomain extra-terminal - transcription regulation
VGLLNLVASTLLVLVAIQGRSNSTYLTLPPYCKHHMSLDSKYKPMHDTTDVTKDHETSAEDNNNNNNNDMIAAKKQPETSNGDEKNEPVESFGGIDPSNNTSNHVLKEEEEQEEDDDAMDVDGEDKEMGDGVKLEEEDAPGPPNNNIDTTNSARLSSEATDAKDEKTAVSAKALGNGQEETTDDASMDMDDVTMEDAGQAGARDDAKEGRAAKSGDAENKGSIETNETLPTSETLENPGDPKYEYEDEDGDTVTKDQNSKTTNGGNRAKHGTSSSGTETEIASIQSVKDDPEDKGDDPKAFNAPAGVDAPTDAPQAPNPPILRGVLCYDEEKRKHIIRGNWNYENAVGNPQKFDFSRDLSPMEDIKKLITDAEFSGYFTIAWLGGSSKGKMKERSRKIHEKNVMIKFIELSSESNNVDNRESPKTKYRIEGTGQNEFGAFTLDGTADPTSFDEYRIVLKKHYNSTPAAPPNSDKKKNKKKKRAAAAAEAGSPVHDNNSDALPDPSPIFNGVVCLRGKMAKEPQDELTGLGATSVVTRISGIWANSLDQIIQDPQNLKGHFFTFELEHKSSSNPGTFAVSGRYSGFFYAQTDTGKKKLPEKDVTLRFRKNNKGYHNVEGKGSNAYGKYTISGTLTDDGILTIFRHFAPAKSKARPVTSAPPPINEPGQSRLPSIPVIPEKKLTFDDVKAPDGDEPLEPLEPPVNGTYSAVSRGVLRLNDDGSHGCQGKWAMTREHYTNNVTQGFKVRLEPHFVQEALNTDPSRPFPVDSEMYKGSFQIKKGTRQQKVVDTQVVMKFRKNTQGAFNVYGKGINSIGIFNLSGVLITNGTTGGHIELFRTYPPDLLAAPAPVQAPIPSKAGSLSQSPSFSAITGSLTAPPRPGGLVRRESTRMVKLPSRLEDDDPDVQLSRIMDKCHQVLRFLRIKDKETGNFFAAPVDPVSLGIPTYFHIIKEPMDLGTLERKVDSGEVKTPEEFARLARLVFNNAMTFNVDPSHMVHQAARNLLTFFNQKFEPVEKQLADLRKAEGEDKRRNKSDKKRKRGEDEMKSPKRRRLEEAKEIAAANASAMSDLVSAAGSSMEVSRTEFNMMLQMISKLQQQVVQTYHLIADLSSDDPSSNAAESVNAQDLSVEPSISSAGRKKPRKKAEHVKAAEKAVLIEDDNTPLTTEEQEFLTATIPDMDPKLLEGVINIIRESSTIAADEDEIDLEIDALDTVTQRKLLKYATKVRHCRLSRLNWHIDYLNLFARFSFTNLRKAERKGHRKREVHLIRKTRIFRLKNLLPKLLPPSLPLQSELLRIRPRNPKTSSFLSKTRAIRMEKFPKPRPIQRHQDSQLSNR